MKTNNMKSRLGSTLLAAAMMASLGNIDAPIGTVKRGGVKSGIELTPKQKKARAKNKRAKKARRR